MIFFLSPAPLLLAPPCLLALYSPPPPGVGGVGVVPISRLRVSGEVCLCCLCSVPLSRYRSFALVSSSPLLSLFSLWVSPLLAWRWRCHPGGCPRPSSVLVLARHPLSVWCHPSDVAGRHVRRRLILLSSALCFLVGVIRSVPVIIPIRLSPRPIVSGSGAGVVAVVSLSCVLCLYFLVASSGAVGSSRCGEEWRKKIGGGFSFPSPCLLGCF